MAIQKGRDWSKGGVDTKFKFNDFLECVVIKAEMNRLFFEERKEKVSNRAQNRTRTIPFFVISLHVFLFWFLCVACDCVCLVYTASALCSLHESVVYPEKHSHNPV